jgi:hypothetical protein
MEDVRARMPEGVVRIEEGGGTMVDVRGMTLGGRTEEGDMGEGVRNSRLPCNSGGKSVWVTTLGQEIGCCRVYFYTFPDLS